MLLMNLHIDRIYCNSFRHEIPVLSSGGILLDLASSEPDNHLYPLFALTSHPSPMPWGSLDANTMTKPVVSSGGFREGSASAGCGGSIIIIRYFQSLSTRQVNESPLPNALGYLPPLKRGDRGMGLLRTRTQRRNLSCPQIGTDSRRQSSRDLRGQGRWLPKTTLDTNPVLLFPP